MSLRFISAAPYTNVMSHMTKYFLLLSAISFLGCNGSDTLSNYKIETKNILLANPEEDFQVSIERNDFRFMGVYGYSISVPGISMKCIDVNEDVNLISGTSDATESYEQRLFNAVAQVYSEEYNFKMKMYLQEQHEFKCGS